LQTPEQRRHASNGIWLCATHAKQIDDDPVYFTVEKLTKWKQQAEARSARALLTLQSFNRSAVLRRDEGDVEPAAQRLRQAATRDLAAFTATLKSPVIPIPLNLRLIEGQQVTSFQAAGLAAAIGTFNEIIVVAPPGTGKTTTLLQVALALESSEDLVALFIPLSEWSGQADTILRCVLQRVAFAGQCEEDLKLLARTGQLVLVTDGWNELDAASRKRLRTEIQGMQRDYPNLGIVMSTRIQSLDVPISGPIVEIEPLSDAQQRVITYAYRGDAGLKILDQAWRTRGLQDLVAIPLYLTKLLSHTAGASLPTTKEEVLRVFVTEIDTAACKSDTFDAVTSGFHDEMLSALASEMTTAESVTLSEYQARKVISEVTRKLVDDGQIGSIPQPDAVLRSLVSYHLLVSTLTGFAFQHHQFQEWYSSKYAESLMLAAANGDELARQRLRTTILNVNSWEEATLFACERMSRGAADAVSATASLVLDTLTIDPMLAAEVIFRSSGGLWSQIEGQSLAFAFHWHEPSKIDRATRFMIKSGRPEFAGTIWSFIENPDDQVHLSIMRAGGRFRPSVLGNNLDSRIKRLSPEHRSNVLSELVMYGGIEGIEIATEIALRDQSKEVMVSVAQALHFRQATHQMQLLLSGAPREVWRELARKGYAEDALELSIAERLRQEADDLIVKEDDPERKLQLLLRMGGKRPSLGTEIQALIETANFTDKWRRGSDAVYEASQRYPNEVRNALIRRLEGGLALPGHAEDLLKNAGIIIDEGSITNLCLASDTDDRLAHSAAVLLGPKTTGKLIDALHTLQADLKSSTPKVAWDEFHRIRSFISATPVESFSTALIERVSSSELDVIEELADLIGRHGDGGGQGRMELSEAVREPIIAGVSQWVESALANKGTPRRVLGKIAHAIERIAAPELAEPLARMLERDLEQWRRQRVEHTAARSLGKHDPTSEANHSWTLQYGRAFAAIGVEPAIATLRSHLAEVAHGSFGIDAAIALRAIWNRQEGITDPGPFRGPPEFSDVRARRAERESSLVQAASPFAEDIFGAVDQLLQRTSDDDAQIHALQLAAIGFSIPYGDKRSTIDRLLKLRQPYNTKLGVLTALVSAGETIEAQLVIDYINDLLEDAKTKPWLLQENQGTIDSWLVLLPFTSRPEATIEFLPN
jgi:hypothetical protein